MKSILEIAVFDVASALIAAESADRLELCDDYNSGGITQSHEVLKLIREKISIPVYPIIRPRGGIFFYTTEEFELMKHDILFCKELKYNGVVFGILKENKTIDVERTKQLVEIAHPMQTTFHRAFDETIDAFEALENVIDCGCNNILTSGQKQNALEGKDLIKELVQKSNNRISIVAGSGVRSINIAEIAVNTGVSAFHSAAKKESLQNELQASNLFKDEIIKMKSILSSL